MIKRRLTVNDKQQVRLGPVEWAAVTRKLIQWASACISGNRYYDGPIP